MRYIIIAVLLSGCSYKYVTPDDGQLAALSARQSALEQREDALEQRVNAQGEELNKLRRGLLFK